MAGQNLMLSFPCTSKKTLLKTFPLGPIRDCAVAGVPLRAAGCIPAATRGSRRPRDGLPVPKDHRPRALLTTPGRIKHP